MSRRGSVSKSSMFKLQNEKNVFQSYLEDIQNCPITKIFPDVSTEIIRKTSEVVFDYCYSFSDKSPFVRGLNYNFKDIGFSVLENTFRYREYFPNVSKAFLMGEFNNFNKASHELKQVSDEPGLFHIQFNAGQIQQGTKIMIRLIDHQGTEYHMIPPSCHVKDGEYGVYICPCKSSLIDNPLRLQNLLAFTIDLDQIPLQNVATYLESNKDTFEKFNTIILKNLFSKNKSLLYRFTLDYKTVQTLSEVVATLNEDYGVKTVVQWSLSEGDKYYENNLVQNAYISKDLKTGQHQWALNQSHVFSYFLSVLTFFKHYFCFNGFLFNNVDNFANTTDGMILLKCVDILKLRLFEHGVTLASTNTSISGICHKVLDGGLGIMFTGRADKKIDLNQSFSEIYQQIKKVRNICNCLSIQLGQQQVSYQKLLFAYLASEKGVFCYGDITKNSAKLNKILKLRSQPELFDGQFNIEVLDEKKIIAKKGRAVVLFNLSEEVQTLNLDNITNLELIFNSAQDEPKIAANSVTFSGNTCLLFEPIQGKEQENDTD